MDLGLRDRRAFVGGASKGLGYACAESLVREGARVVLAARDGAALDAACQQLGASAEGIAADLGRPELAAKAVTEAIVRLGGLDILVVNGGGPPAGGFMAHDEAA